MMKVRILGVLLYAISSLAGYTMVKGIASICESIFGPAPWALEEAASRVPPPYGVE